MISQISSIKNVYILFVFILLTSCTYTSKHQWYTTNDSIMVWLPSDETISMCTWEGETFANIAHGNGVLSIWDAKGNKTTSTLKMFYGTSSISQIIYLGDGSKYVGSVKDSRMHGFGVLEKENELFIGNFDNNKPRGYLKLYKEKKIFYDGNWENGSFHGDGILYKDDGTIRKGIWEYGRLSQAIVDIELPEGHYKGTIKDGLPEGYGTMTYDSGSVYNGNWLKGKWNGEGLYINNSDTIFSNWKNGELGDNISYITQTLNYEGSTFDGKISGIGVLQQIDGSYYSGMWYEGQREGVGDMLFPNGDLYMGDWEGNEFHGVGTYFYEKENAKYNGEWVKGLQHGIGVYRCKDFEYDGEWDSGWMNGDGIIYFNNGDKYEGTVHENIIDGIGSYNFANGNYYEGEFFEGKITGLGVFQFVNGDRFEGEFLDGKIYGDGTMYLVNDTSCVTITGFWPLEGGFPDTVSILFPNGDLYEGPIVNGKPSESGKWVENWQGRVDKVETSSLNKLNNFYKKHRKTINWCLTGVSVVVTGVETCCASTIAAMPIAVALHVVNVGINAVDASLAISSAAIDLHNANELGVENSDAIKNLATETSVNAALILVPKAAKVVGKVAKPLGKGVKNIVRSNTIGKLLKNTVRVSSLIFIQSKILGKKISIQVAKGARKVEKIVLTSKITQKPAIAIGRILTSIKHQTIPAKTYLSKLMKDPKLASQMKHSKEGSSSNLLFNMNLFGTSKFNSLHERLRRYLGLPKKQIEAHHIIPSNPQTGIGKKAREILTGCLGSVDHPCNGILLPRASSKKAYKGLAKGCVHSPNSLEYENIVSNLIITFFKNNKSSKDKCELLLEVLDEIKRDMYNGKLCTGNNKLYFGIL